MPISIAIDAREPAFFARLRRRHHLLPSGAMLIIKHAGEREAGLLGLGQGADIALTQFRQ